MFCWGLLISGFLIGCSHQDNLTHYEAGVVEYAPDLTALTFANRTAINLDEYLSIIFSPEATGLDIIVFPESTLNNILTTTFVPEPEDKIIPCYNETFEEVLREISCAAREKGMYIVINLTEKSNCTEEGQELLNDTRTCSKDGLNKYNTNVVFDRKGTVISRYRKVNFYGELQINRTMKPDVSTFKTDFDVTFGHFISFDLIFSTPALDIISQNVTDIIYPTMWLSALPFLTAVQIQQSWAYKYDVNLLAAGASYPLAGSTGSGIYAGKKGSLISLMAFSDTRKLLRSSVAKKGYKSEGDHVKQNVFQKMNSMNLTLLVDNLTYYSSVVLSTDLNNTETRVCNNKLCCNFKVTYQLPSDEAQRYEYHLVVFNGVRSFNGMATGGVQTCSVVACTDKTIKSCGTLFSDQSLDSEQIIFSKVSINGLFENNNSLVLPNSVNNLLMPLDVADFSYSEDIRNGGQTFISYELLKPHSDLLNFGIYGRTFSKDGWNVTNTWDNSGSTSAMKYHLWICIPILCFMKFLLK